MDIPDLRRRMEAEQRSCAMSYQVADFSYELSVAYDEIERLQREEADLALMIRRLMRAVETHSQAFPLGLLTQAQGLIERMCSPRSILHTNRENI